MSDKKDQLSIIYKHSAEEKPRAKVDQRILDLAKKHQEKHRPSSIRKYLPYSMVASIGLIALLIHSFPQYYFSPPQPNAPLGKFDSQPSSSKLLEKELAPVQALPAAPEQKWQYQQSDTSVMPEIDKQRIIHQAKRQQKASISNAQQVKASVQAVEEQRLSKLQHIKQLIDSGEQKPALIAIEQYLEQYSGDSLPKEYLDFYQKNNSK